MQAVWRFLVIPGLVINGLAVSIPADDWPQWRGPHRDAVLNETNLLEAFPADGLKIRWRIEAGNGWASPVIADGRVVLIDARLNDSTATERVRCLDEKTGNQLWLHEYDAGYPDWAFDPQQKMGPYATALINDGKVYTRGGTGTLLCLDAADGHVVWSKDLLKDYGNELFSGNAPCPLIEQDLLILMIGGRANACVVAFNKLTGEEVWAALTDTWSYSSPIVISSGGVRQLIVWRQHAISSLNPETGEVYWEQELITSGDGTVPTPVFQNDRLLIGGLMLKLDPGNPAAEILWPARRTQSARMLSNTSMPVIQGDCVYSARVSGELVCLDADTGEQLWATDKVTDAGNGSSIHITPNGDSMLLFTSRGELIRAKLSREGYRELSRVPLIEPTYEFGGKRVAWSVPAYANGHVFVRNQKELICASLKPDN